MASTVAAACALLFGLAGAAGASTGGGFDLTWRRVASGGTMTASGGAFTLSGTIAQHEAGALTGGGFSLLGGFWQGGTSTAGVDDPPAPPHTAVFALRGFARNPASLADLRVSYSLPDDSPARLELLDVSGRCVARAVPARAGVGTLTLEPASRLAPGLYWLRLTQGTRSATRRAVLVR